MDQVSRIGRRRCQCEDMVTGVYIIEEHGQLKICNEMKVSGGGRGEGSKLVSPAIIPEGPRTPLLARRVYPGLRGDQSNGPLAW